MTNDDTPPRARMEALGTAEFERILRESALDVAGQIHELDEELIRAADLCAAVREYLADCAAGERKGLAKTDGTVILLGQDKTEHGPMLTATCAAFGTEPGGRIMLTRREALVIDASDGAARISVRKISW